MPGNNSHGPRATADALVATQRQAAAADAHALSQPVQAQLAQVWGDTVTLNHLGKALLICMTLSGGIHVLAHQLLPTTAPNQRLLMLLAGLAGCLLGGVLCTVLFTPKRRVVHGQPDSTARKEIVALLAAEPSGLGRVEDLPAEALAELHQLGLHDVFAQAQADQERRR